MAIVTLAGVDFISFQSLAKESGLSAEQLLRAVNRAGLPTKRFGNKTFIQKALFEKWVKDEGQEIIDEKKQNG